MFPKGKRFAKENEEAEIIGIFDACFGPSFYFDLWGQILENANSFRRIIFDMHCIFYDCLNIDNLQGRKVSRMKN